MRIIALRALSPSSIKPPFARYSHGIAVPAGHRLVFTSGQLGIDVQRNHSSGLRSASRPLLRQYRGHSRGRRHDIGRRHPHQRLCDRDREHMQGYMHSRDRQFQGTPPASTLVIVSGFTRPEFLVEIEVVAAAPEHDRIEVALKRSISRRTFARKSLRFAGVAVFM